MGLIQFDKPRTRPTPDGVGASPAWIGRGLVALFDARYGIERISGDRASVNTATRAVSEGGVAADFSGTANQRYAHRPAYAQVGPFSLLILCDIDALTNYGALISKQASATTYCPYELRVGYGPADSRFEVVRCSPTTYGSAQASVASVLSAPASLVRIVLSVYDNDRAAKGTIWINGTAYTLNPPYIGDFAADNGVSDVWIGRRQDGATQLDGRIYHIGLVNRAVTAGEAYDFTRNPWSVFEPKRIWVPVPAGGGTTYTFSPSGSVTFSGAAPLTRGRVFLPSGVVVFSGTSPFTATGVANYTFIVSGGVTLSGASPASRGRVLLPSGVVAFSGSAPFSSGASTSYTFNTGGSFSLSGVSLMARGRVLLPSGSITFSGAALWQKGWVYPASGQVQFSGTANMYFTSGLVSGLVDRMLKGMGK